MGLAPRVERIAVAPELILRSITYMDFPRKTAAAFAFAAAFVAAIGLTAFLSTRPRPPASPPSPPVVHAPAIETSPIPFRVEQAVIDFSKEQSLTTLVLEPRASELPPRVWVWAVYYAPEGEADGKGRREIWTSEPAEIVVGDRRRLDVSAKCSVCAERPAGKPTYYVRVHVVASPPDAATLKATARGGFDLASATPVIVHGMNGAAR